VLYVRVVTAFLQCQELTGIGEKSATATDTTTNTTTNNNNYYYFSTLSTDKFIFKY
jgi:hypothetical protein